VCEHRGKYAQTRRAVACSRRINKQQIYDPNSGRTSANPTDKCSARILINFAFKRRKENKNEQERNEIDIDAVGASDAFYLPCGM